MKKTAILICIGLSLLAAEAQADPAIQAKTVVLAAGNTGLFIRTTVPATIGRLSCANVCAGAVNTGGVARANTAVKAGGRVFLTNGSFASLARVRSTVYGNTRITRTTTVTPAPMPKAKPKARGLGYVVASLFGLAR